MHVLIRNCVVTLIVVVCFSSYSYAAKRTVATFRSKIAKPNPKKVLTAKKPQSSKKKSTTLKSKIKQQLALLQTLQSQEKKTQAAVSSAKIGLRRAKHASAIHRNELMRRWKQKLSKNNKKKTTTSGKNSKILFPTEFGPLGEKASTNLK